MNTNLPQKYEFGFFSKIKNFFSKFFRKDKQVVENKNYIDKIEINKLNVDNSIAEMRKASENAKTKEDILEIVRKNPEVIENLSEEKLEKLDQMCDDKIIENDKKIEELKLKYAKMQEKLA